MCVDIVSTIDDPAELFHRAVRKLRMTSFPNRSAGCWRLGRIELRD